MDFITASENYDYKKMSDVINALCNRYPFLSKQVIGKSCAGRDIIALKVGRAERYALFASAFHGSEHITTNILLYFIEELCAALESGGIIAGLNAQKAMFGRGAVFIPRVNPDGCEISIHGATGCSGHNERINRLCKGDFTHWNANLRGVDINHNFDAGFEQLKRLETEKGIFGPAPTRFGGNTPESEPETVALTRLCKTDRIQHVLALHTQGEVIYWTYGKNRPHRSKRMAEIMATSSGYALDVPLGIAVGGGFKDWFIDYFNRPGFTVEIGTGKNPLPIENAFKLYLDIREMLTLTTIM